MNKLGDDLPKILGLINPAETLSLAAAKIAEDYQKVLINLSKSFSDEFVNGRLGGLMAASFSGIASAASVQLQDEISQYRSQIKSLTVELADTKVTVDGKERIIRELQTASDNLSIRIELAVLLDRISVEAGEKVQGSKGLQALFFRDAEHNMFVMSIDIRRSTELMLKASSPQKFATFITTLCGTLDAIVKSNHGVVDKFTGDGILCFFPEFFTGEDVGYYAMRTADQCHTAFQNLYQESRSSFNVVLLDTGLGIGVDYGTCPIVKVAGGLTVVGSPVVYACRFGAAPAGITALNFQAYDQLHRRHSDHLVFRESSIEVKHEGDVLAYTVTLANKYFDPAEPAWRTFEDLEHDVDSGAQ